MASGGLLVFELAQASFYLRIRVHINLILADFGCFLS